MQELLAFADDETRRLWDGLVLGYTETLGSPLLRHEIAGLYETLEADDVIAVVGRERGAVHPVLGARAAGRPRDRAVAGLPVALRPGARAGRRRRADRAAPRGRLGARPRPHRRRDAADDARAWSSTSRTTRRACTSSAAEFDALAELVERHGATLVCDEVYRGLEYDPAARLPGRRRSLAARRQRGRALEVLRARGPARGLAGDARPRPARRRRAGARLHLALQPGAVRGARHHRAARRRRAGRAQPRHHRGQPAARRRADRRARREARLGAPDGGIDRLPALPRRRGHRRVQRAARAPSRACCCCPGRVYDYGDGRFRLGFGRTNLPEAVERLDRHLRA